MNSYRVLLILAVASLSAGNGWGQVTYQRLLEAAKEPQNWLTYSGDYAGWRHSALEQIRTANVQHLAAQWVFQSDQKGKFETTPLVVDGVMYVTGQENLAYALDARTGRTIWRYRHPLPEKVLPCCGKVNRGFAALGDKVFLATLDAHVVALDAKTGNVVWDVAAADYSKGYVFTLAPLAVKDKIIVGVAGGEYGIRGFIDAYFAETGKRAWRFYTIPGPGEPGHETWEGDSWEHGGSPAWLTGTYDPELNLTYWGIGNPGPDAYGEEREGDNLYSDCVVALDADTGKLKWYFQFTPHDVHDWDATEIPVLLDMEFKGKPRKLLVQANRNAFYYVLDRTNGEFLHASAFARQTWAKEIGPDGRPVVLPGTDPTPDGNYVCPGVSGATNWMSPSYNPRTGLFYVATREQCDMYFSSPQP
jgi:alcohol dehydrogenase (cytochrome c)